jgi:hypothetical protein
MQFESFSGHIKTKFLDLVHKKRPKHRLNFSPYCWLINIWQHFEVKIIHYRRGRFQILQTLRSNLSRWACRTCFILTLNNCWDDRPQSMPLNLSLKKSHKPPSAKSRGMWCEHSLKVSSSIVGGGGTTPANIQYIYIETIIFGIIISLH